MGSSCGGKGGELVGGRERKEGKGRTSRGVSTRKRLKPFEVTFDSDSP